MRGSKSLRIFAVVAVLSASSTFPLAAQSLFAGTWKMNAAASKSAENDAFQAMTLTYEKVGDKWRQTGAGIDHAGNSFNQNYLIAWDGKDLTTEEPGLTLAVTQIDDHSQNVRVKKDGMIVDVGDMIISKDGKTMTFKHEDPNTVQVFDRQ